MESLDQFGDTDTGGVTSNYLFNLEWFEPVSDTFGRPWKRL
jgi:hypothetical protein